MRKRNIDIYSNSDVIQLMLNRIKESNLKSNDISDLYKTKYYKAVRSIKNNTVKRLFLFPYNYFRIYKPELIRAFVKDKNYTYEQGNAMLIRTLITLFEKTSDPKYLNQSISLADNLAKDRSDKSKHMGWGQPFVWYSSKGVTFPPHIPRATVTAQVAWAFLDVFRITKDKKYLNWSKDICELFINEFNYTPDKDGDICFSYTTLDNYHVHNANLLAASIISRVYKLTGIKKYQDFAKKSIDFSLKHQNEDGSFYYWAPPNKVFGTIDNYHTGFVLECLKTINEDFDSESYNEAYEKGLEYYFDYLFEDNTPKLTPKSIHPIDVQSCAQSIITFASDGRKEYLEKANQVADYSISNLFLSEKNHFAYRIYKNGFRDESYYFRWGDAWMLKALSMIL